MAPAKELKDSLQTAMTSAQKFNDKAEDEEIKEALAYAAEIAGKDDATEGEYKKACTEIANAVYYLEGLEQLLAAAEGADKAVYTEYAYTHLTEAAKEGRALLERDATKEELLAAYNNLLYWYTLTGEIKVNVAAGKSYTTNIASNTTYPDTDNKELTDGKLGDAMNTYSPAWAGFNGIAEGQNYEIIVDLGEVTEGLQEFSVNAHQQSSWGIKVPSVITIFVSDDGTTWTPVTMTTVPTAILEDFLPGGHTFTATVAEAVSGRYIKYALKPAGQFVFISEVTANVQYK